MRWFSGGYNTLYEEEEEEEEEEEGTTGVEVKSFV